MHARCCHYCITPTLQANLAVQEAKYESAMKDLNSAQAQLDDKQRELDAARALYEQAMTEKQACFARSFYAKFCINFSLL